MRLEQLLLEINMENVRRAEQKSHIEWANSIPHRFRSERNRNFSILKMFIWMQSIYGKLKFVMENPFR